MTALKVSGFASVEPVSGKRVFVQVMKGRTLTWGDGPRLSRDPLMLSRVSSKERGGR